MEGEIACDNLGVVRKFNNLKRNPVKSIINSNCDEYGLLHEIDIILRDLPAKVKVVWEKGHQKCPMHLKGRLNAVVDKLANKHRLEYISWRGLSETLMMLNQKVQIRFGGTIYTKRITQAGIRHFQGLEAEFLYNGNLDTQTI